MLYLKKKYYVEILIKILQILDLIENLTKKIAQERNTLDQDRNILKKLNSEKHTEFSS